MTGEEMFEWQAEMSVGIEEFDSHHQRIIELINKLAASKSSGDEKTITREVLTELVNYAVYHFFAEEAFMEKINYPEYPQHWDEHLKLTEKTLQLLGDLKTGKANIGQEVLDFLVEWLTTHIMVIDMKYAIFFKEHTLEANMGANS